MTFSEKLLRLRRQAGMSQEELAERLQVSRQAVSRWELGTAMPDAPNLLALSKLYAVSADYLLRDEWETDRGAERAEKQELTEQQKKNNREAALLALYVLTAIAALLGFIGFAVLQRGFVVVTALMLHVAIAGGFEVGLRKHGTPDAEVRRYRRKFYRVFIWFAALFPVLSLVRISWWLFAPFINDPMDEIVIAAIFYLPLCFSVRLLFREPQED